MRGIFRTRARYANKSCRRARLPRSALAPKSNEVANDFAEGGVHVGRRVFFAVSRVRQSAVPQRSPGGEIFPDLRFPACDNAGEQIILACLVEFLNAFGDFRPDQNRPLLDGALQSLLLRQSCGAILLAFGGLQFKRRPVFGLPFQSSHSIFCGVFNSVSRPQNIELSM